MTTKYKRARAYFVRTLGLRVDVTIYELTDILLASYPRWRPETRLIENQEGGRRNYIKMVWCRLADQERNRVNRNKSKSTLKPKSKLQSATLPREPRKKERSIVIVENVDVTSPQFLDTYAWKKLRYKALKKYGRQCQCCGSTKDINVDHIKPRKKYPELALRFDNLQILCDDCNAGKGNWDETDWRPARGPESVADIEQLIDLRHHGLLN